MELILYTLASAWGKFGPRLFGLSQSQLVRVITKWRYFLWENNTKRKVLSQEVQTIRSPGKYASFITEPSQ